MPQYPTCSHIKEDGSFCQVAALRDHKYCYYHLRERLRALRRARALRDNAPYRIEITSLDNPYAVRNAVTEVVQALGAGQLDPLIAGRMLYGIQLARAENKLIAKLEAEAAQQPAGTSPGDALADNPRPGDAQLPAVGNAADRVLEFPELEKQFDLAPGADLDTQLAATFRQADQAVADRRPVTMPTPPSGVRPGSAAYHVYREECYQSLRVEIADLRFKLREYLEQKRQESAKMAADMYQEAGLPIPPAVRKAAASALTPAQTVVPPPAPNPAQTSDAAAATSQPAFPQPKEAAKSA